MEKRVMDDLPEHIREALREEFAADANKKPSRKAIDPSVKQFVDKQKAAAVVNAAGGAGSGFINTPPRL
jgi:hypothetical protein